MVDDVGFAATGSEVAATAAGLSGGAGFSAGAAGAAGAAEATGGGAVGAGATEAAVSGPCARALADGFGGVLALVSFRVQRMITRSENRLTTTERVMATTHPRWPCHMGTPAGMTEEPPVLDG